jgi:HEAT repeat protein
LAVLAALLTDEDVEVRRTVLEQLMSVDFENVPGARGLTGPVMEVLARDRWPVAAHFLGQLKANEATALLASLAQGDDVQLRNSAVEALGEIGTPDAEVALRVIADTPTDDFHRQSGQIRAKHWLDWIAESRDKPKRRGR